MTKEALEMITQSLKEGKNVQMGIEIKGKFFHFNSSLQDIVFESPPKVYEKGSSIDLIEKRAIDANVYSTDFNPRLIIWIGNKLIYDGEYQNFGS